jgi:hypothetical protein
MLIDLIILVVIAIVAHWVITKFFPQPAQMVALVVVGIILLLWLLNILGVLGAVPSRLLK